jgi:hypothetical protein
MLQRPHERVGIVLAVAVIALTPLCIGAQHTPVLLAATIVAILAAFLLWVGARPRCMRQSGALLVWLAVALTAFTLLQALPLPLALLRTIAPKSADIWARSLSPFNGTVLAELPTWGTLSVDPIATQIQALRGLLYLATFLACMRIANRREGIDSLLWVLAIVALILGVSALAHPLFGATRVFGVYEILNSSEGRHVAPLPNPNHLAGYLNVGIAAAIGLGVHAESARQRAIPWAVSALLIAIQIWVASRGGVIAMVLVVIASAWVHRRAFNDGHRSTAFALLGLAAITSVLVIALADDARRELLDTDGGKLRSFAGMMPVIKAYPIWGTGRGAFESAFTEYRAGVGHVVFAQPENLVVQWLAEWGPFVGTASLLLAMFALRLREAVARPEVARSAWVALVGAFVHNMGDFNSEVPGVAVAFVVCAACVTAGVGAEENFLSRWSRTPRVVGLGVLALLPLTLYLGANTLGKNVDEERRALRARTDAREPLKTLLPALRAAMKRHPAEPFFPYLGALSAYHERKPVLPWVGRTLERAPVYGRAHYVLAKALFFSSPAQARLEYRLAVEQDGSLVGATAVEVEPLVQSYDDATELLAEGANGAALMDNLSGRIELRLPATSARMDAEVLERSPKEAGALQRRARHAAADLNDGEGSPWCADHAACAASGLDAAARLQASDPTSAFGHLAMARILASQGKTQEAYRTLDNANTIDSDELLRETAAIALRARDEATLSQIMERIRRASCDGSDGCVRTLMFAADLESTRNNPLGALSLCRRARTVAPTLRAPAECIGQFAERVHLNAEAAEAYEWLARVAPTESAWAMAAERARQAAARERLGTIRPR